MKRLKQRSSCWDVVIFTVFILSFFWRDWIFVGALRHRTYHTPVRKYITQIFEIIYLTIQMWSDMTERINTNIVILCCMPLSFPFLCWFRCGRVWTWSRQHVRCWERRTPPTLCLEPSEETTVWKWAGRIQSSLMNSLTRNLADKSIKVMSLLPSSS